MELWITCVLLMQTASCVTVSPSVSTAAVTPTEDESARLVDWLMKYGYLPPPDPATGQLTAWTAVTQAVKAMQQFAGIKDTGVMDEDTMALLKSRRCSLPDQEGISRLPTNQGEDRDLLSNQEGDRSLRRKRAVSMWKRRNINWRLRSYPTSSHLSRETIRSMVYYALRVWAEPTPLEFHEVGSPDLADLQVDFLLGYHGDGYPFDGAGGAVGHAFFPSDSTRAGGVHLDAEEEWAFRQPASEGTDLFTVLLHEFGHALGLTHSSSKHSVMRPYYQGPAGDPLIYRLGAQDLEHITGLYGNRNQLLATDAPRLAPEPQLRHRHHRHGPFVDRCNTSFDAVAKIRGETFFFKGLSMWRVHGAGLVSSRGASVRRMWRALPADMPPLQAVMERHTDHAIIFIAGSQFWVFRDLSLEEGFPKPLSELRMGSMSQYEEEKAEVAGRWGLVWDRGEGPVWGKIGIFEEKNQNDTWNQLLREGVSGITTESDGSVYLFKGNSYWKFTSPGSSVLAGYPQSLSAGWLDCTQSLSPPGLEEDSNPNPNHYPNPGLGYNPNAYPNPNHNPIPGLGYPNPNPNQIGRQQLREGPDKSSHTWTKCSCQNGAYSERTISVIYALVPVLVTWTLSAF